MNLTAIIKNNMQVILAVTVVAFILVGQMGRPAATLMGTEGFVADGIDMDKYILKSEIPPQPDMSKQVLKSSVPKCPPCIQSCSKPCKVGNCPPCPRPRCPSCPPCECKACPACPEVRVEPCRQPQTVTQTLPEASGTLPRPVLADLAAVASTRN